MMIGRLKIPIDSDQLPKINKEISKQLGCWDNDELYFIKIELYMNMIKDNIFVAFDAKETPQCSYT